MPNAPENCIEMDKNMNNNVQLLPEGNNAAQLPAMVLEGLVELDDIQTRKNLEEAMATPLRNGYKITPFTLMHAEDCVALFNRYDKHYEGVALESVQENILMWQTPGFNPQTDIITVRDGSGVVVGHAELWDVQAPYVRKNSFAVVDPEHMGQGIGTFLISWLGMTARQRVKKAPQGARVVLQQGVTSRNSAAAELFGRHGFKQVRRFRIMKIDFDGPCMQAEVPEGIHLRSMRIDELEAVVQTVRSSFKDHWGAVDEPFEQALERYRHYVQDDPNFTPHTWYVAEAEGRLVGVSLCDATTTEDPAMGWVRTLGVVREFRKRGLGMALLRHSFVELQKRGCTSVGLGVDAYSLTGANLLYEKAGMHIHRENVQYELELRAGQDLTTQAIE